MSQAFLKLLQRGATAEVADAIAADPSLVTWRDPQGVSSFLWAIYCGQPIIRDFLLERLDQSGVPLDVYEASALGDPARLEAALEHSPSALHEPSGDGWTALHLAAAFGTPQAVQLLLLRGATVDAISANPQQNQPLHAALSLGRNPDIIRILLSHGADPNATQARGFTALFSAAAANRRDLAEILIAHGANPAHRDDLNQSSAGFARERGHTELADWLDSLPGQP